MSMEESEAKGEASKAACAQVGDNKSKPIILGLRQGTVTNPCIRKKEPESVWYCALNKPGLV